MERRIAEQLSRLDHDILRHWNPAVTVGVQARSAPQKQRTRSAS